MKAHLRMHKFKEYLHAKCLVAVAMHKEEANESLRKCDYGLRNSDVSSVWNTVDRQLSGA